MIYYFNFKRIYDEDVPYLTIDPNMELRGRDLHKFIIEHYGHEDYNENLADYEKEVEYSYKMYKKNITVLYSTSIDITKYNIQYT